MRESILKKLADIHANYPGRMLILVILLTVIFGFLSTKLTVSMRWSDLLPSKDRRTIQYNKIIDEFTTSTSFVVVAQGEEKQIKAFADAVAPKLKSAVLETDSGTVSLISRVDYKMEMNFLKNHGLMLMKKDDLENMKEIYTDPNLTDFLVNLNNAMEKEYVGRDESLSTRQKEDQAVMFLDGIEDLIRVLNKLTSGENVSESEVESLTDGLLLGDPYFLSYDKKALILNAIPTFSVVDLDLVVNGTNVIQNIVDETAKEYPGLRTGLTGMMPICHDEMVYSEKSLGYTSLIAIVAILVLLIVSFRMWVAPLFAIANLLIGILWAIGLVSVTVGQLNIMTQMMAVILLGLGIDFSIHLISGFTEFRAKGQSIQTALETTFLKVGRGVITGGLTTASAFLTMIISSSRGMKEMGLVTGIGLLATLIATFLVLPIFLVYRERHREKKIKDFSQKELKDISFQFMGSAGNWLGHHFRWALLIALVLTGLFIILSSQITFDQNYMNIEAKGLTSIALQDTILNKFDLGMDYAMVLVKDPDESRQIAKQYREMGSIAMTEDISAYLPSESEQKERAPYIREIQKAMASSQTRPRISKNDWVVIRNEINRLRMNVMEMQDMAFLGGQDKVDRKCRSLVGNPDDPTSKDPIQILQNHLDQNQTQNIGRWQLFQREFASDFKQSVLSMASTKPIHLNDLPVSILDQYSNADHSQYLVTVYPAGSIWNDAKFLHRFNDDLDQVSDKATGMPPVFLALIEIIGRDGRNAMFLTIVVIFLLLLIDFRNVKHTFMAMIPLAAGLVWMIGLMKLTGQQFTVMNVMGLPMILGIGIDDGVHIIHRWVSEGRKNIRVVFASTGKAILLTSLTTMLGFGSMIFSVWRGFGQLGAALFVGVGACFLTTVLFLSGLLGWLEHRKK